MTSHPPLTPVDVLNPPPTAIHIPAGDGYMLHGHYWRSAAHTSSSTTSPPVPVVVINPATSVASRYYGRFARYLQGQGMDVLTYDYRGIGLSRPARLRGLQASWLIWGQRDFEAVLQWLQQHRPEQPIDVVAHSIGGLVTGLAPSAVQLHRICSVAAQVGYWGDYARPARRRMFWKWQCCMPVLTAMCGYFPGQRLGWLEDTPYGVVQDWTQRLRRYEQAWDRGGPQPLITAKEALMAQCARVRAPTLAIGLDDDDFGTVTALERLLEYFPHSPRTHIRIQPQTLGVEAIGHFAFFHERFASSLWPLALQWLRSGQLPSMQAGPVPYTEIQTRRLRFW